MSIAKKGKKVSEATRKKMCLAQKGHIVSQAQRKKISDTLTGRKMPKYIRKKISEKHILNREKSHLWKGGINAVNDTIRKSVKYKLWREAVFKRDKYLCKKCNKKGYIHAHHIKPFSKYKKLRFELKNGMTLCRECHKKIHKKR